MIPTETDTLVSLPTDGTFIVDTECSVFRIALADDGTRHVTRWDAKRDGAGIVEPDKTGYVDEILTCTVGDRLEIRADRTTFVYGEVYGITPADAS